MAATIAVLALSLAGIVFYVSHALKNQHTNLQLPDASQKAIKIIDEANSRALDIVNKADLSTAIASSNFNQQISHISSSQIKTFEKTTADFIKTYSQVLQDLKSKNIEMFQSVSKAIEVNTIAEIKSFKESMEKLTVSSEKLVKKKIDTDYETAKKEIEDYKVKELSQIDDEIYAILERIAKLALGKTLSLSEHEDLIQKSLEKAKKEGVFK